jgi:ABC-type multidrug transport system fused ATPase/permease subunit
MEPWLTVYLSVFLGLAYIISFQLSNRSLAKIAEHRFQANQLRFHLASEAFTAFKDLKATGQEYIFTRRYDTCARQYAEKYIQAQIVAQAPRFFLEGLMMGVALLTLLYFLMSSRQIEAVIPTLSLFIFAGYRLIPSLQAIFRNLVSLRFISPSLYALHHEFISLGHLASARTVNLEKLAFDHELALRDISFTYPNAKRPTFQKLSLTIPSGMITGLVGSTGSGKTTLVDLILGLLWPDEGQILIDGVSLSTTTLSAWQAQVGYVSQHVLLLDDTIAANIAFGLADQPIDYAAMEQAAHQALIHDFIVTELPQGYETKVGERGVRLSGGQRQRLGIARALYRKPHLLVFDESTSALDNVTEQKIMQSLDHLRGQVTIVMIAHRMSTVKHCDHIILLEHGRVSAQGSFEKLLATSRSFRDLNQGAIASA